MSIKMIPTTCKCKLPEGFSYAMGAQAISKALEEVDLYSNLNLAFHDNPFLTRTEFTLKLKEKGVLPVLRLNYHHLRSQNTSKMMVELGLTGERWYISLYPIPSEHKKHIKEYLDREGLPKLRD